MTAEGFWGPVTATLDWCESNYDTCSYIAEFWNTTTNLVLVALSIYGIVQCRRLGVGRRYELAFASAALVGVGSWMFHATLQYAMQMLDELPMIYTTLVLTFIVFEIDVIEDGATRPRPATGSSATQALLDTARLFSPRNARYPFLPALLFATGLLFSLVYTGFKINPLFHQVAYACCVFALLFRSAHLVRMRVISPVARKQLLDILVPGLIVFALGFVMWNLDNIFCRQLTAARAHLPAPLDGLLQLHAWWHVMTGIGAYSYIIFCTYLRVVLLQKTNARLSWAFFGLIPYLGVSPAAASVKKVQ